MILITTPREVERERDTAVNTKKQIGGKSALCVPFNEAILRETMERFTFLYGAFRARTT